MTDKFHIEKDLVKKYAVRHYIMEKPREPEKRLWLIDEHRMNEYGGDTRTPDEVVDVKRETLQRSIEAKTKASEQLRERLAAEQYDREKNRDRLEQIKYGVLARSLGWSKEAGVAEAEKNK